MSVQLFGVIPSIAHSSRWFVSNQGLDAVHVGRMHAGMRVLNMVACAAWIAASIAAGAHRNARKVIWLKLPKSQLAKM